MTELEEAGTRRTHYFYLSYARSAPLATDPDKNNIDHWVRMFYQDLSAEVRRRLNLTAKTNVGFFDGLVPPGSDWAKTQTEALSSAEVFVPLYSPAYLDKQWPLRERESFRRRLAVAASRAQPAQHIIPVLWIPFPSTEMIPEVDEALRIGQDIPGYAEDGLRALGMLSGYEDSYRMMVVRLAGRIVQIASAHPLGYSSAPAISELSEISPHGKNPYLVAVIAPAQKDRPSDAPADTYGKNSLLWRPFGTAQAQPIAVYAAAVAERLGLPTQTMDVSETRRLEANLPGVLLIDPWIMEATGGADLMQSVLSHLDSWVQPLIVMDMQRQSGGETLSNQVVDMLGRFGKPWSLVKKVDEFVELMPILVTETRRRFLRGAPVNLPEGPIERGRLTGEGKP